MIGGGFTNIQVTSHHTNAIILILNKYFIADEAFYYNQKPRTYFPKIQFHTLKMTSKTKKTFDRTHITEACGSQRSSNVNHFPLNTMKRGIDVCDNVRPHSHEHNIMNITTIQLLRQFVTNTIHCGLFFTRTPFIFCGMIVVEPITQPLYKSYFLLSIILPLLKCMDLGNSQKICWAP